VVAKVTLTTKTRVGLGGTFYGNCDIKCANPLWQ